MISRTSRAVALVSLLALLPGCGTKDANGEETSGADETSSQTGETSAGETSTGDGDGDGGGEWEARWGPGTEERMALAFGMAGCADGGAVIVGRGWSAEPFSPGAVLVPFVRKYNADGTLAWETAHGELGAWNGVVEDEDGTLLLVGEGNPQAGNSIYYRLARASADGELIWDAYSSEAENDFGTLRTVAVAPDGSIYAGGDGPPGNVVYGTVRKYDANGVQLWRHDIDGGGQSTVENYIADEFWALAPTPEGGVVAAGSLASNPADGGLEALVKRLDASGQVEWEYTYNASGDLRDAARGVAVAPDGKVLFAGRAQQSDDRGWDALHGRLDTDGSELWVETVHSLARDSCETELNGCDGAYTVTLLKDLNYAIAGHRYGPNWDNYMGYVSVVDPSGVELWSRDWDTLVSEDSMGDFARASAQVPSGAVYFMGSHRLIRYLIEY